MSQLKEILGYTDQDISFENEKPERTIFIKRDTAAALGITVKSIAETIKK